MAEVKATVLSTRVQPETLARVDAAAAAAGQTRSQWLTDAVALALAIEVEDKMPARVREALPRQTRRGVRLPTGRTFDRDYPRGMQ